MFQAHAGAAPRTAAAARGYGQRGAEVQGRQHPSVYAALATLIGDIATQVKNYGAIKAMPAAQTPNVRNDMYLASDACGSWARSRTASATTTWPS